MGKGGGSGNMQIPVDPLGGWQQANTDEQLTPFRPHYTNFLGDPMAPAGSPMPPTDGSNVAELVNTDVQQEEKRAQLAELVAQQAAAKSAAAPPVVADTSAEDAKARADYQAKLYRNISSSNMQDRYYMPMQMAGYDAQQAARRRTQS